MKLKLINKLLEDSNFDAVVFVSDQNRYWVSGFESSAGYAIVTKDFINLFVDGRYYQNAISTIKNPDVRVFELKKYNDVSTFLKENNINKVLVESEYIKYDELKVLSKDVSEITGFNSKKLRIIKEEEELLSIAKAANIAVKTLTWLKLNVKPGMTEIEVANLSYQKMNEFGATKASFDTIVASGVNGGYPHHHPSNKVLEAGEFVTIDMGCIYNGYCSDITRTFVVGGGEVKNETLKKAYEVVKRANEAGIKAVKAGVTGAEVDKVCRDIISATEFKDYFVHSTGHGVGIDVHELPNVSPAYHGKLLNNAIVTIEPGIYIPNVGGIRIEDMVLVHEDKPIVLTYGIEK